MQLMEPWPTISAPARQAPERGFNVTVAPLESWLIPFLNKPTEAKGSFISLQDPQLEIWDSWQLRLYYLVPKVCSRLPLAALSFFIKDALMKSECL